MKLIKSICSLVISSTLIQSTWYTAKPGVMIERLSNKIERKYSDKKLLLNNDEIAQLALIEANQNVENKNFYSIKNFYDMKDFSDNEYLFVSYAPYGYSVISKYNYQTIEFVPFADVNISDFKGEVYRYVPTVGMLREENEIYTALLNPYKIKKDEIGAYKNGSSKVKDYLETNYEKSIMEKNIIMKSQGGSSASSATWVIDINNQTITANKEISHSWFFKYNTTQFAYADERYGDNQTWFNSNPDAPHYSGNDVKGLCEYIAFLLIMEYHQYFSCNGYFNNSEESNYVNKPTEANQSFEDAIPTIDNTWILDIWKSNNYARNLNAAQVDKVYKAFVKNKSITSKGIYMYWLFGNPKDVINHNRPDMLCGMFPNPSNSSQTFGHNVVAYGYFNSGTYNGKYLCHYGWEGNYTQCILDRGVFQTGYDWSITNTSTHQCSNSFYVNNQWRCGCESN